MNLKTYLHILRLYFRANNMAAYYPDIKAQRNRVNLWELDMHKTWKGNQFGDYNLGDYLARVVVEYMLSKKGLSLDTPTNKTKHLNSIGSNLLYSFQDATIWGSGIEKKDSRYKRINTLHRYPFRKLDIRAVRGPLTMEYLRELGHHPTQVYGDPAILMPYIYNPTITKDIDYTIIPQYYTEKRIRESYPEESILSMATKDYERVISRIKASKKVISSSLHGIILAESYGVPAVFFRGLNIKIDFKYKDYYYSTGRFDFPIATTVEEALKIDPLPLPDLTKLQEGLIASFPYDLWDK